MKNLYLLPLTLFIVLVFAACSNAPEPTPAATEAVAVAVTEEALPTDTPTPTATPVPPTETPVPPTDTPVPTATPAPPTNTPTSTNTPEPTQTSEPTNSPTPVPPTATPTPDTAGAAIEAFERGMGSFDAEQYDAAIVAFQQAIDLDSTLSIAYVALGYSYAFGPGDYDKAIEMLEKYLELSPDADNRAEIESDLQRLRELAASTPSLPEFDVPPGKALFVFINYTHLDWNIDVGPYFLQSPGRAPDQESSISSIVIDPGTYSWKGLSADGTSVISNPNRDTGFEFTVAAGEITVQSVGDRID